VVGDATRVELSKDEKNIYTQITCRGLGSGPNGGKILWNHPGELYRGLFQWAVSKGYLCRLREEAAEYNQNIHRQYF